MNTQKHLQISSRKPEEVIAFRSGAAVRVDDFLAEAIALSEQLPSHRYVFNLCADRYQYLLGFCAAVMAGQCTLMPPNRLAKTIEQLTEEYPDSYSFGDTGQLHTEVSAGRGRRTAIDTNSVDALRIPGDQLCAVVFTSGTTGRPAPNLKYWETIRTGSISNADRLLRNVTGQVNLLATVPPQHMWGFETSILLPLFTDAAVSQQTPFFPQDIAAALESLPESRVLISTPVHLRVLLKSGVRIPKLERIFCATAPLSRDLALELESRFKTEVIEVFGSSETGMLASRFTATESLWRLFGLFELEVRKEGFLVRGKHLPEPVFLQDAIEMAGEHRFRWLGRHADMVKIAGNRGSLTDLNARLLAIQGVVDGVIFVPGRNTERLAAIVVAPELDPADILAKLRLEIDPVFLPRSVYMVPVLPRLETGKLAHKELMKLYSDIIRKKSDAQVL